MELEGHNLTLDNRPPDTPLKCFEDGYFVAGYIQDKSFAFLVDTGSCCTILSKKKLENWPSEIRPDSTPVNLHQVTATGESYHSLARQKVKLPLVIKNCYMMSCLLTSKMMEFW